MKVAVFCGSSCGESTQFINETKKLGTFLAKNNIDVVYGGGKVGLMGAIADSVIESGGKVYGVIPEHLKEKEIAHTDLTELSVVSNMHERKAKMAEMADAFVALPGGTGTLEEIFEAWTWAQLGHHSKPCAFYNINRYYEPLKEMIFRMTKDGFLKPQYQDMLIHVDTPQNLLIAIQTYQPPKQKWT